MSEKMFKLALESVSITIYDHIRDLQADSSMQSYRRWIWELIQNAIDLCDEDKACAIKCQLSKDQVIFMHNGTPFEEFSLNHLFFKKTSKKDKVEGKATIGNFGTGFLTTHLLSKRIEISGVYRQEAGTYSRFENFVLDREGDYHQITENLFDYSNRLKELEKSPQTVELQQHSVENTKFCYPIKSELPQKAVTYGVQDLQLSLPYSIVFISHLKKLQSIKIDLERLALIHQMNDELAQEQITAVPQMSFTFNYQIENLFGLNVYKIENTLEDSSNISVFELHQDSISICLPMDVKQKKRPRMRIEARHPNLANLFLVFPLIGTEKVNFPFIINSFDFKPTKERNGIILFGPDSERVNHNRNLIVQSLELSKKFIRLISQSIQSKSGKWKNLHLLAEIQTPANKQEYIDIEWYTKTIIRDYKAFLFDEPLVHTDNGFLPLRKCRIPYHIDLENSISFAGLFKQLFKADIPSDKILKEWIQAYMIEEKHWPQSIKMTIVDLTRDLSNFGFKHFLISYQYRIETGYKHLNGLIETIEKDSPDLLIQYPILPNQEQEFQLAKSMYIDQKIPEVYKDMHDILYQSSIRKILLDHRVITTRIQGVKSGDTIEKELLVMYQKVGTDPKLLLDASFKLLNYRQPQLELSKFHLEFLQIINPIYTEQMQEYTKEGCAYVPSAELVKHALSTISKSIIDKIKDGINVSSLIIINKIQSLQTKTTWLFSFLQFLTNNHMDSLFIQLKVIPNKQGNLIFLQNAICDENIEPKLLQIYDNLLNHWSYNVPQQHIDNWGNKFYVSFEQITPNLIDPRLRHDRLQSINSDVMLTKIMKLIDSIHQWVNNQITSQKISIFKGMIQNGSFFSLLSIFQVLWTYCRTEEAIRKSINDEMKHVTQQDKNKTSTMLKYLQCLEDIFTLINRKKLFPSAPAMGQQNHSYQLTYNQVEQILDMVAYYFVYEFSKLVPNQIMIELSNLVLLLSYISEKKITGSLSLLIELCPIIPNQKMELKKPDELKIDRDDVYFKQGTSEKLKLIYDKLRNFQYQNNPQPPQSIFLTLSLPQIDCKLIKFDHNISSTLNTVDTLFKKYKNEMDKATVIEIFKFLDHLLEHNPKYDHYLREFKALKPTLYLDLFQTEQDRNKVLDLVSGNQLNNAYFLKQATLDKHFRPNTILYYVYIQLLLKFYKQAGVNVKHVISSQEMVLLQGKTGLPVRVMIFFAMNPTSILLKPEEIALILSHKEFVDLQIIDVSQPLNKENIGEYSHFISQFDQILLKTKESDLQKELIFEELQTWDSYISKLKIEQVDIDKEGQIEKEFDWEQMEEEQ